MTGQKVLREGLGTFELGRVGARAETGEAGFLETVNDARNEWRLGAHDCQVNALLFGESDQAVDVIG
jgi:hypothetical protein